MARRDQHFMVDARVALRMVERAELSRDDVVLEVGAGHGELTGLLAERAGRVMAFELDGALAEALDLRFPGGNVEVVHADAARAPLPQFTKAVANLPYSISSAFTLRLLGLEFRLAVLTYQMEFARRLLARPGQDGYSRLSVLAQYRADVELLERIPRTAFRPRPRVDSAMVRLSPRPPPYPVGQPEFFVAFLAAAFFHRRKTLRRALLAAGALLPRRVAIGHLRGLPPELLEHRAEELTGERLAFISDALYQNFQ